VSRHHFAIALLPALLVVSSQPRPTVTIGGEDGRGAILGRVKDVQVVGNALVVLEEDPPHIRVFGHDGRLRQTLGRTGAGPGEYRAPFTLAGDSARREVLVVDPANARLTRYLVADTLALVATTPVDVPMTRAVCRDSAGLLVLAGIDSVPVRSLELRRDRLVEKDGIGRKASHYALASHPMLRSYIAQGPMLCATSQDRILVASPLVGEVLVLQPSRPAETILISLPGFRPLSFAAVGAGLQLSMPASGYYERVMGLRMSSGTPVATTARIASEAPRSEVITGYRLVEIRSGRLAVLALLRRLQLTLNVMRTRFIAQ
jgi:hypothetical protein